MTTDRKALLSLVISIFSVVIASWGFYKNNLEAVDFSVAVSPDIFVANSLSGKPDVFLQISFWADGPPRNSVTVETITLNIKKKRTDKEYNLRLSRKEKFPKIVPGGTVETAQLFFVVNDYIEEEVKAIDAWCNELANAFPSEAAAVEKIRSNMKKRYLPSRAAQANGEGQATDDGKADMDVVSNEVKRIIRGAAVEQLDAVLPFTSGEYEVTVTAIDPMGGTLAEKRFVMSISEVLSNALRYNFNSNTRVRMEPV